MSRTSIALLLCCLAPLSCGDDKKMESPPPGWGFRETYPAATPLDNGAPADQRKLLYHLAEGSELFPTSWFEALIDDTSGLPFKENLERFGFLPDPDSKWPIGMTEAQGELGIQMIGVNCAACHVGQIHYKGKALRIDGAPNQFAIEGFYESLVASSLTTLDDPEKLLAFGKKVLLRTAAPGPRDPRLAAALSAHASFADVVRAAAGGDAGAVRLRESVRGAVALARELARDPGAVAKRSPATDSMSDLVTQVMTLVARLQAVANLARERPPGTPSGFGRTDAFGIARNILFPEEPRAPTAPINYPHLWGFGRAEWLHWNGNTNSVVERNIGQALGLGAVVNRTTLVTTVRLDNLHTMEQIFQGLRAPVWPADVFGPIDATKKARGETVYKTACASCHDGPYMQSPDGHDVYPQYGLDEIGTDPNHAMNFDQPVKGRPYFEALGELLGMIKAKAAAGFPAADVASWEAGRTPVKWRSPLGGDRKPYPARPLAGVWATAPYLHNGSVPTLMDLLSPPAMRPVKFGIGYREYDPDRVGYRTDVLTANPLVHEYDTTASGNSNGGHAYGVDLPMEDKAALVEYLKGL